MNALNPLYKTTWLSRFSTLSAVLLAITGCVPGQDSGNGGGAPVVNCDPRPHHRHPEWDDDKGKNHRDWDDDKGFHHHEWDDDHGKHHREACDDRGHHHHDFDDDHGHHHRDWKDDRGHNSRDWDDDHGHHHDGDDHDDDDDGAHTVTSTSTSTACQNNTATVTNTSTSTSTSTATSGYQFPILPGRTCTVDSFQQQGGTTQYVKKVDILFVMDHSPPMDRHWQEMATNIESMVRQLPASTDIRYAVLLADVSAWSGRLYSPFGAAYLDNQRMSGAQIAEALQRTFSAATRVSDASGGEVGIYSLYRAVTAHAAENQRAGFFRPDAGLSVIFMSDGNDIGSPVPRNSGLPVKCDANFEMGVKSRYYDANSINVTATIAALKALKGERPVKASAFVNITAADVFIDNDPHARCLEDTIGYGYVDIASATGGTLYSIHQDVASGLAQCGKMIAQSLELQHDFQLSHPANQVDPATILSVVDGALVNGTYHAANNSEHLENAGQNGSTIQIRYCAPVAAVNWNLTAFTGTPSQTSVGLSWLTSEYATSGKVMWGTTADALTNEADEAGKGTNHAVTVSGLTPNTLYYFQATSADEFGVVKTSPVISVRTYPDWTITNVAAQAARTSASVTWTTAEYATKGHVIWGLAANALTNQSADAATANAHNVALTGLSPATTYFYQVVSSDEFGLTKSSDVLSFTTEADWGIFGLAGAATRTSVTLDWSTPDQATNGQILWGRSTALGNVANEGGSASTSHQLVVSGLTADTDYYFQAVNTDPTTGQVKSSNVILVHTAVDWNVTGFAGTSTTNSVTVSWTTPGYSTSGAVAWGTDGATLGNSVADTANGTAHSLTVVGLNPDTVYYFRASSTDVDGITKASAVVAIRTQPLPLPTWSIANFAGTSTKSSVTLTWDTTQYATSGAVVWGTSLTSMNNQVSDTVTGTHHSVTITGLAADTIYFFQALASDNRGQNKSSDVIQVRTMADSTTPPSNWTIVGFDGTSTANQVNLIWNTPGAPTKATVKVGTSATDLTLMSIDVATFAATQQLAVPGLTPSTQYFFQVVATDTAGRTVESVIISKTTKAQ
jgi:hypothetical protein